MTAGCGRDVLLRYLVFYLLGSALVLTQDLVVEQAVADNSEGSQILADQAREQPDGFMEHKHRMSAAIAKFREDLSKDVGGWSPRHTALGLKRPTKGILIAGGGQTQFVNALATMRVIREVHESSLPITFAYYGKEEYVSWIAAEMKEIRGVHLKDVSQHKLGPLFVRGDMDESRLTEVGYYRKILAVYHAPYSEVLYLDSDSMPLSFPDHFFADPAYIRMGNFFFPEVWREGVMESPTDQCYELLGLEAPWHNGPWSGVESGQFLFNVDWHKDVLDWVVFLNSHHDSMYACMYGDKDTFEMAFMLAGKANAFFRGPVLPRLAMEDHRHLDTSVPIGAYRLVAEVHHSEAGIPWFLHRVGDNKLSLSEPVWMTPRPSIMTSPITHELTHKHLKMTIGIGHTLPPEVFIHALDCATVDYWTLRAWHNDPRRLPVRSRSALSSCLAALPHDEAAGPAQALSSETTAAIPLESFGEEVIMCLDLQYATLEHLKLKQQQLRTIDILGGAPDHRHDEHTRHHQFT